MGSQRGSRVAKKLEGTLFLKPVKVEPGPAAAGDACLILLYPPGPVSAHARR